MTKDTYQCAMCKTVFETGWTDEEATAELGDQFPGHDKSNCDVVCDDCYKLVMGTAPPEPFTGSAQGGNA